jgi:hypothetical protein
MGFFDGFSRRVEADSAALQKRDCKADFWLPKAALHRRRPHRAAGSGRKWQSAGDLLERFQAKWKPVRVKKTRQTKILEPRFDSIETEKALERRWQRLGIFAGGALVARVRFVQFG